MFKNIDKYKNIHLIGIGGISMSAIAETLSAWGYNVSGSDCSNSSIIENLQEKGISVTIGHNPSIIKNKDLIIFSAAIKETDLELSEAKKLNIECVERADFIGYMTTLYKNTICISGTHGKTTTTSMVALCFMEAMLSPTIQVGAILKQLNSNYSIGSSDIFILEACEYVESFLKFNPKAEIILNIDNDHLDYFKNFNNINNAFIKFAKKLPTDGILVTNADDKNCLNLQNVTNAKFITYGIENTSANYIAKNISYNIDGFPSFDVYLNNSFFENISLSVPGKHNILNALACIALSDTYKISKENIKNALLKFTGANRRFEYIGTFNDITVFDDYAHHPTEILATSNALKNKKYNQSWVVFQSHTYSRTLNLLKEFATALSNFDNIIITDIYAAREINIYNVTPINLIDELQNLGKTAIYISDFTDISNYLKENAKKDDIIITVGAGTINEVGSLLLK